MVKSGGIASINDYTEFKLEIEKLIDNENILLEKTKIISNYIKSKTGALAVIEKNI